MTTTRYAIEGMTCEHCEQTVQGAVEALAGVTSARASKSTGSLTIDSESQPKDAAVRAAVEEAGYALTSS